MNRYTSRIRDAWSVLVGRKVAVEPARGGILSYAGTSTSQLLPSEGFSSGPSTWYFSGNSISE